MNKTPGSFWTGQRSLWLEKGEGRSKSSAPSFCHLGKANLSVIFVIIPFRAKGLCKPVLIPVWDLSPSLSRPGYKIQVEERTEQRKISASQRIYLNMKVFMDKTSQAEIIFTFRLNLGLKRSGMDKAQGKPSWADGYWWNCRTFCILSFLWPSPDGCTRICSWWQSWAASLPSSLLWER